MDKIEQTKNNYRKICEKISHDEDYSKIENLNIVENIISKDNTEPIFVQKYLKLLYRLKPDEFQKTIKKYEFFITKEWINNEFSNDYVKNLSSSEIFVKLYEHIINYSPDMDIFQKNKFYREINLIVPKFNPKDIKGFTDYSENKELSIYILVQNLKKGILKHINEIITLKINDDNPIIKLDKLLLKEAEIFKKVIDYDKGISNVKPTFEEREKYQKIKPFIHKDIDEYIADLKEDINIVPLIETKEFSKYFTNLSNFLTSLQENFLLRFQDLENLKISEFKLLRDFCFFIQHYQFKNISYYKQRWNDTFCQSKEYIENISKFHSIPNVKEFRLENNNLIAEIYSISKHKITIIEIDNIYKYSINCIIDYLTKEYVNSNFINDKNIKDINISEFSKTRIKINQYDIEKYLKFDCQNDIYIKKIWPILEKHLLKIFTSPVIKAAFEEICQKISANKKYDFLEEKELIKIFANTRIFQFQIDFLGLTEPFFGMNYVYYRGMINSYIEEISKLLNILYYQITQEHEILGHLNVRIQDYLSETEISSPILEYKDKTGKKKTQPESGDYVENLLFGECIGEQININTILFILDEDNYNLTLDEFQKKFKNCKTGTYTKSKSLLDFLNSLEINIDYEKLQSIDFIFNEELFSKSLIDNKYLFNRGKHSHYLHPSPPKERNESIRKYIDDQYEKLYKSISSGKK